MCLTLLINFYLFNFAYTTVTKQLQQKLMLSWKRLSHGLMLCGYIWHHTSLIHQHADSWLQLQYISQRNVAFIQKIHGTQTHSRPDISEHRWAIVASDLHTTSVHQLTLQLVQAIKKITKMFTEFYNPCWHGGFSTKQRHLTKSDHRQPKNVCQFPLITPEYDINVQ